MLREHKKCFGQMLPVMLHGKTDHTSRGKSFAYRFIPSNGTAGPLREVTGDIEQWDDCRLCEEFDDCYKFCTTKLFLEIAASR